MESLYYTIDESAKAIFNNKFYVEQDAIDAAVKAAKAFKYPIKIWVWNSFVRSKYYEGSGAVHFATVYEDGRLENKVNPVEAVAYALEARGLKEEALALVEIIALREDDIYSKKAKVTIELENHGKRQVEALFIFEQTHDINNRIKCIDVKFNGVSDPGNGYVGKYYYPDEFNIDKIVNKIVSDYAKFPPFFEEDEFADFHFKV